MQSSNVKARQVMKSTDAFMQVVSQLMLKELLPADRPEMLVGVV